MSVLQRGDAMPGFSEVVINRVPQFIKSSIFVGKFHICVKVPYLCESSIFVGQLTFEVKIKEL